MCPDAGRGRFKGPIRTLGRLSFPEWTVSGHASPLFAFAGAIGILWPLALQQPEFRATTRTVVVYATVRNADGHLETGLGPEDFELRDNGRPVSVAVFSGEIVPITGVVLFDVSTSTVGDFLFAREALRAFVDQLLSADRNRLGSFGGEIAISPILTGDKRVLSRIIQEELWPRTGRGTALWSGLHSGMAALAAEQGRRVVVVFSDGDDACPAQFYQRRPPEGRPEIYRSSTASLTRTLCATRQEVETQTVRDEVIVYALGVPRHLSSFLTEITDVSGGGFIRLQRTDDIRAVTGKVIEELHHQYLLGFVPTVLDGKIHDLEVRMKSPGLTARARRHYTASSGR